MQTSPFWHSIAITLLLLTASSCRKSAAEYAERATTLYDQQKYPAASLEYKKALQQEPQNGEYYYRLALCELRQSRPVDAYRLLIQAVQLAPQNLDAKIQLADIAFTAYERDEKRAKHLYDQINSLAADILSTNPKSADGLRLRGMIALIDKKPEEAIDLLKQADISQPMQAGIVGPLAKALLIAGRAQESEKLLVHFIDKDKTSSAMYDLLYLHYIGSNRMSDAEDLLKSKAQHNPNSPDALLQLASHYGATQRQAEMAATLEQIAKDATRFPQGPLRVGDFFMMRKEHEEAAKYYQSGMASAAPNDKQTYRKGLARALVSSGKTAEAETVLGDVLKEDPSDVEAQAGKASLLLVANKNAEALPILQNLVKSTPGDIRYRVNLARVYSQAGDLRSAIQEYSEALKIEPRNIQVILALAELSQRGSNHKDTLRYASDALSLEPANSRGKLLRTMGLIGQTNYPEARAELLKLLREQPQLLEAHLQLGLLNVTEKRYQEADAVFQRFYQAGQGDLRPLAGLVETRIAQRQFDSAIQLLEAERKRAPQSLEVRLALASTAVRAGRFDLALQVYEDLSANYPDRAEFHSRIGQVYQSMGKFDLAIAKFQSAEKLAPRDWTILASLAHALDMTGRKDAAAASYRKSLRLSPGNVAIMNNLAFLLAEMGTNLDEAATMAEEVRRRSQDNPAALDTLGYVYLKRGQHDSALQVFNSLTQKYPQNAIFQYRLAQVYAEQGQKEKAKQALQKAVSNNPPKPYEAMIQELMKRVG